MKPMKPKTNRRTSTSTKTAGKMSRMRKKTVAKTGATTGQEERGDLLRHCVDQGSGGCG